jgi:hypothetical protein
MWTLPVTLSVSSPLRATIHATAFDSCGVI